MSLLVIPHQKGEFVLHYFSTHKWQKIVESTEEHVYRSKITSSTHNKIIKEAHVFQFHLLAPWMKFKFRSFTHLVKNSGHIFHVDYK